MVNEGDRDTDEVLQIYIQNEGAEHAPRNPRLCAFRRIHIPAKGEMEITLAVPEARTRVVDDEGHLCAEGTPVFYVGLGQPDERTEELTGHHSIRV